MRRIPLGCDQQPVDGRTGLDQALLGGEYLLLATGESSLFTPQNYVEFTVVADSTGRVSALRMSGENGFSIARVR